MRKSFAKVKKFITTRESSESSQVNSSRLQVSSVPELVLQNQNLRQRISLLEKEKEVVERSIRNNSFGQEQSLIYKVIAAEQSSRIYKSLQRQNYHKSQNTNWKRQSANYDQITRNGHRKINSRHEFNEIYQNLESQRLKNKKLELKIQRLNETIDKQEKDKRNMLFVIEQLRRKLKESTEYLLKLQKLPNPEEHEVYLKKLEDRIAEKQQTSFRVSQMQGLSMNMTLSSNMLRSEVEKYHLRISDYVSVKQQNCSLRDRLAWLTLSNKKLQEKVIASSRAIDHLWKIKDIQIENLSNCLKEIKQ